MIKIFILIFMIFFLKNNSSFSSKVDDVVVDGIYYDWIVYYTNVKDEEKQCYMVSFAKETKGNYKQKRQPYIAVTVFNSKNSEEFSIFADYKYKINSAIHLGIDNKQFRLFVKDSNAWAKNNDEDSIIIKEILDSNVIKVKGETITGEYTIDVFTVRGAARAYKKIHELCK